MNFKLDPLFAYPVLLSDDRYDLKNSENNFIKSLDARLTSKNKISSNTYVLDNPELKHLKQWCMSFVNKYYFDVMQFADSKPYITQSWVNFNEQGDSHDVHCHQNSFISGVFHFEDNQSGIEFSNYDMIFKTIQPKVKHNIFNSFSWRYPTRKNSLILFPSSLWHKVETNDSKDMRMSLSFNTWISGEVGQEQDLTSLKL